MHRLVIQEVPPSGNIQKRLHWARYSKLLARWFMLVRTAPGFLDIPGPVGRRSVTLIRHGTRLLDRDNLYSSMKPVLDVLRPRKKEEGWFKSGPRQGQYWTRERIGHGLIIDDDPAHLNLEVLQVKTTKGQDPFLEILFD